MQTSHLTPSSELLVYLDLQLKELLDRRELLGGTDPELNEEIDQLIGFCQWVKEVL
jgi:hypothetical protein